MEIINVSAEEVVYHQQQWPTPIYFFTFYFAMDGTWLVSDNLEGEVFSQDGISRLAPGDSLSCAITMKAYDLPHDGTRVLPIGRYQMDAFYHMGEYWKEYQAKYGMTPVHLNRPVALIDLIDNRRDLPSIRRRWASRKVQEANLNQGDRGNYRDKTNTPLAVLPVVRFDKRQDPMEVKLEIQNFSDEAIRYRRGSIGKPMHDLKLILTTQRNETPLTDGRDPSDDYSVATLEAHQSIPVSISLKDFGYEGTEGVPLGRYKLHASYSLDDRSAAEKELTPIRFDRTILLIDVVED
ncbi:MAG: hypothetical protein ACQESR_26315 [Planctomycetota bacterium]